MAFLSQPNLKKEVLLALIYSKRLVSLCPFTLDSTVFPRYFALKITKKNLVSINIQVFFKSFLNYYFYLISNK